ncbi:hypothetical protein HK096_001069, partial [Nowakowskiella sp. JEL0078]
MAKSAPLALIVPALVVLRSHNCISSRHTHHKTHKPKRTKITKLKSTSTQVFTPTLTLPDFTSDVLGISNTATFAATTTSTAISPVK